MGEFEKVGDAPRHVQAPVAEATELAAVRQDLDTKTNEIKALQEHAEEARKIPDIKLDDGLEIKSKDGNFKAALHGRIQVDSQVNLNQQTAIATGANTQNLLADGVAIRRGRIGVEGTFFKDWDYKFEYDFTRGNGTTGAGVTDAFIRWNLNKAFSVKAGSFKLPFSLEQNTSNRYNTFIERNMSVNTFSDSLNAYKVGIGANYAQPRYQVAVALQTEPVGANGASNSSTNSNGGSNRNGGSGDTNWEVNARVTGTPWMESNTKLWHIGASGSYVNVNNNYLANGTFNNGGISFTANPNTNVDRSSILDTGNLSNAAGTRVANHLTRFGAETALVYGPFSAQGEYIQTDVMGKGYHSDSLTGWYGYATYFLTGESRNYRASTGTFDRQKPNRNFDMKGGWGAWELAGGYDHIDLNDGVINGGRASTAKFGLNWYPNSHVRVMANYIKTLDINTTGATNARIQGFNNADLDILETRVQLDF
jgi:phosphate-selective porin OprO/OprP